MPAADTMRAVLPALGPQAALPALEPRTQAVRRALAEARNEAAIADLLFLETWEASPNPEVAAVLRVAQIRRANPALAEAVRGELNGRRRT
jgi:hypothetical protein